MLTAKGENGHTGENLHGQCLTKENQMLRIKKTVNINIEARKAT